MKIKLEKHGVAEKYHLFLYLNSFIHIFYDFCVKNIFIFSFFSTSQTFIIKNIFFKNIKKNKIYILPTLF